jgi:hypothetical protein
MDFIHTEYKLINLNNEATLIQLPLLLLIIPESVRVHVLTVASMREEVVRNGCKCSRRNISFILHRVL